MALTWLVDDVNNPNHSCGEEFVFGGSDKVVAYPVAGANKYKFRFEDQNSNFARNITGVGTSNARILSWVTSPLQSGESYDVSVAISFDNGANFCPFGPSCQIDIVEPPAAQNRDLAGSMFNMSVYPNPNRGEAVNLVLNELEEGVEKVQVDMYDSYGKIIHRETIQQPGQQVNMILDIDQDLSEGVYVISVMIEDQVHTSMLVVQ